MSMKWYWFSFSHNGINQGCCNVQAKDKESALQKTIDLRIHPKHDNIETFELDTPELEPDRLFSKHEMIDRDYETVAF